MIREKYTFYTKLSAKRCLSRLENQVGFKIYGHNFFLETGFGFTNWVDLSGTIIEKEGETTVHIEIRMFIIALIFTLIGIAFCLLGLIGIIIQSIQNQEFMWKEILFILFSLLSIVVIYFGAYIGSASQRLKHVKRILLLRKQIVPRKNHSLLNNTCN